MIFITVGSAFPFDRLTQAMNDWALRTGRGSDCIAQIGRGEYRPTEIEYHSTLTHSHFSRTMQAASVVIAHAGMGTVITSQQYGVPIVIMPRRLEAGEHTTDHQAATARWLEDKPGVFVAWDEGNLTEKIAEAEGWVGNGVQLEPLAPRAFTDQIKAQLLSWDRAR